jgi:hypothetical protein
VRDLSSPKKKISGTKFNKFNKIQQNSKFNKSDPWEKSGNGFIRNKFVPEHTAKKVS